MGKGVPFTELTTMTRHIPPHADRAWVVLLTTRGEL